jgi:hypothetical protein
MLSVIDTLKETLLLWMRNLWYLRMVVLVLRMPGLVFDHYDRFPRHSRFPPAVMLFVLIGSLATLGPLVPKLHLGTRLLRQFHCRPGSRQASLRLYDFEK